MQEKEQGKKQLYRQRVPRAHGCSGRSLYGAYQRALALCASMESAEHQIILAVGLCYVLEMPQERFETALRKFKRRN